MRARDVTDEIMQVTQDDPPVNPESDHLLPSPDEPRGTVEYLPPERRRCAEDEDVGPDEE